MQNKTWRFWGMLPLLFLIAIGFHDANAQTDPDDLAALQGILSEWTNAPPNWGDTNDPCGSPWQGVICGGTRVTTLHLPSMGIEGDLSSDIGSLTELTSIDMSYNPKLGGPLPWGAIVKLKKLTTLLLLGCSFNGPLPTDLGNLTVLRTLDLNKNKFIGSIPESVGNLSELYWLDIASNRFDGALPVTLGQLSKAGHFHFNQNNLSGTIPAEIFHENMALVHVLFDSNNLTGKIPETLGLVTSLTALRLDRNQLTEPIPSNITNLKSLIEMNLGYNKLSGIIPDLSEMGSLSSLVLSNNSFDPSDTPNWFTNLQSLNTLKLENGNIQGELPTAFFELRQLEEVRLSNNKFNGTLDITGSTISEKLKHVYLEDNNISSVTPGTEAKVTILSLSGNPACNNNPLLSYCLQPNSSTPYTTSLRDDCRQNCNVPDEQTNPATCTCSVPYKGTMVFRAPSFSYLGDTELFQSLEEELWTKLDLQQNSVYLSDIKFNAMDYLNVRVSLFNPGGTMYFNRSQIQTIAFRLSNQTFKPPEKFGTFYFEADTYNFPDTIGGKSELSSGAVAGIVIACAVLLVGILILGIYAFNQKKKAERATVKNTPFASWAPLSEGTGAAPQLKGARWFSFAEVDKCTNKFSDSNEIGAGGYGKVYRGTLPSGQVVAIKRSQKGSSQGELEFKTEIELLSRLHHRNLVGFVGFCFDQGEQMLVYEFVSHGTLRENLAGKTYTPVDWKRRLKIALDSARGLSYLHDLADPPIIHRDIKSANILLDENLTAKVADFGLSKLVSDTEKSYVSTQVKGTLGYLDPEYYMSQQLTDKSDVYSFGVVMLELVTSKLPIENGKYIVREIRQAMREKGKGDYDLTDFVDPVIRNSNFINIKRFVDLAMQCVEEEAINRPRMNEIVKEIESILQNEGSNPTSASSSQTEFPSLPQHHSRNPYSDQLPLKDINSDAFINSTGYPYSDKIEPV